MKNKRLYNAWKNIKQRCYDPNRRDYKYYGGKGIKVCDKWLHNFQAFNNWAITHGYADNLTLDRVDVNGNYEPSNCRWVDMQIQANNKSNNHFLTYNGKTQTIAQWSREVGISQDTIRRRINAFKWSVERALTEKAIVGKNQTFKHKAGGVSGTEYITN